MESCFGLLCIDVGTGEGHWGGHVPPQYFGSLIQILSQCLPNLTKWFAAYQGPIQATT